MSACRKLVYYMPYTVDRLIKDPCVRKEILKLIKASGGSGSITLEAGSGISITGSGTPSDPYIIGNTGGGGSSQESFYLQFISDGDQNPVFSQLVNATLIWFEVEDLPYGIPDEVSLDNTTGTLDITGGIGSGQRVKLQFKKLP